MATTIKLKNGTGAPSAGALVVAEPALDLTNKRLYTEDSGGTVIEVGTNPTSVTTGDITATGTATFAGLTTTADVSFGDNDKAIFGAGSDLQIWHAGDASYIGEVGTGNLIIYGDTNIDIQNAAGQKTFRAESGGPAYLYHANNLKLNTTSTGIDVTGTVTADGLTVEGNAVVTNATNATLQLQATGGNAYQLRTDVNDVFIYNATGARPLAKFAYGGDISFYEDTGTTAKLFWDASAQRLDVQAVAANAADSTALRLSQNNFSAGGATLIKLGTENTTWSKGAIGFERTGDFDKGALIFCTNNTTSSADVTSADERMRIDSSGNLLVGKTSDTFATAGTAILGDEIQVTRAGVPMYLRRNGSDGDVLVFYKDGAQVGSIATWDSDFAIGQVNVAFKFDDGGNQILPWSVNTNLNRDDAIDLGDSTSRWKDVYATNGTIQTSDRNEKQDIKTLSDVEQRVAVAAKGLLRKFRWIDAVEAKGDDARIHFGIIAQDLQDAFTAEGLDAGRYAMFINSTWTDEETGEERSRMGVRYSELLAFIIAAI